jgi:glutamate decarboxylase
MERSMSNAHYLSAALEKTGRFRILSDLDHGLPLVCFALKDDTRFTAFELVDRLRERGWIIPAYHLAPDAEHVAVARVVVREGFSHDMADMLLADLARTVEKLDGAPPKPHRAAGKGKRHKVC